MMQIKKLTIAVSLMLMIMSFNMQAQFSLTGELRPRAEMSHGYKSLAGADQDASIFTYQRTRLNFNFTEGILTTKVVLQDVRVWGNQKQLVGNEANATSIHEAWAEAKLTDNFSIKLGRQELVYDDSRIFGNVGWAQQARSHDVALLKYSGIFTAHLGIAHNENTTRSNNIYDGPDAYKDMLFLWLNKKTEKMNISFLFLNNGVNYTVTTDSLGATTSEAIRYSQTLGPRLTYKLGKLNLSGNYYLQLGEDSNGKTLNAFDMAIAANYNVNKEFQVGVSYEILSGTADGSEENNSFSPFYGTNHKFNGYMDYFYVGNHMNSYGLNDLSVNTKYKFSKSFVSAAIHMFSANADINAEADKNLGTEIDLVFGHTLSKDVKINVGYSHMLATESMELLKGGSMEETSNWAWIMFTFKPSFLSSK